MGVVCKWGRNAFNFLLQRKTSSFFFFFFFFLGGGGGGLGWGCCHPGSVLDHLVIL